MKGLRSVKLASVQSLYRTYISTLVEKLFVFIKKNLLNREAKNNFSRLIFCQSNE